MILLLIVIMFMLRKQHIIMTCLFYPMFISFNSIITYSSFKMANMWYCSTPEFNSDYKYQNRNASR